MPTFNFCAVEHQLEVVDRSSTTFRSEHKFSIEATLPSRFFIRDFFWTGSGQEKEPVPEVVSEIDTWGFPIHRIHGPLVREGNSRILIVDLGRTIGIGEKELVHFRHRMKDLEGTFRPFFKVKPSSKIRDSLVLRVVLPEWEGLRVLYRRFTHDTEKVVETEEIKPTRNENEKLCFEKQIFNPSVQSMGHKLEWSHQER